MTTDTRDTIIANGSERTPISLLVNGKRHQVFAEPRDTLLDVLRKDIGLTGTKRGAMREPAVP